MCVEVFFHCSRLSCLACVIGQSSEKVCGGVDFLTFESDILFSLGKSQCSIFVSKIHIGSAKSSHAGVRRSCCQEDPVALFRNQRVIQQNQATQSKDQVHPVISLGFEDLHAFKLICNLVRFLFTYSSPAQFLWLLRNTLLISVYAHESIFSILI